MQYHVSRGSQTYGPYTLADLQRYVASGHILLTDLARSEAMSEWTVVGQILNPVLNQGPAAEPAPGFVPAAPFAPAAPVEPRYGAPDAAYPVPVSAYPDPPNLHWGLVLLIDVLTGGIFQIAWNFVMAAWLKRVQWNNQAILFYALGYVTLLLYLGMLVPLFLGVMHHAAMGSWVGLRLVGLVSWILRLVARYSFKAGLEEHFNRLEPIGYHMNGVLLFFFGGLYIQAELNRINEIKLAIRHRDATR
jgi:hypothetical protein